VTSSRVSIVLYLAVLFAEPAAFILAGSCA